MSTRSPASSPATTVPAQPRYVTAHQHSTRHRSELERSERCGCFFCFHTFAPTEIVRWVDGSQTALCPRCSLDSVLGTASGFQVSDTFLRAMHRHWFYTRAR